MALVKTWAELKQREGADPAAAITIQASLAIAKVAMEMVEGAQQLPPEAEQRVLDAVAKAGSGAFQRAYDRAIAGAMRVIIEMVADMEAERTRQEVLNRLKQK